MAMILLGVATTLVVGTTLTLGAINRDRIGRKLYLLCTLGGLVLFSGDTAT